MIRLALLAVLGLLSASPAGAVVFSITVGGTTYTENITAPNAARLQAWAAANYATLPNPAYVTPCGSPLPACLPQTIPDPSPAMSAFKAVAQGIKNNVTGWEKSQAHAAIADPAPIN